MGNSQYNALHMSVLTKLKLLILMYMIINSDKGLLSKIDRELIQLNNKTITILFKNEGRKTAKVSFDRPLAKEAVLRIPNGILLSHKIKYCHLQHEWIL